MRSHSYKYDFQSRIETLWRIIFCWHLASLSDYGRCWCTPPSWGRQAPPTHEYKIDGAPNVSFNQIAIDPNFGPRAECGPYKASDAPAKEKGKELHPDPRFVEAYDRTHASHHQNPSCTFLRPPSKKSITHHVETRRIENPVGGRHAHPSSRTQRRVRRPCTCERKLRIREVDAGIYNGVLLGRCVRSSGPGVQAALVD